MYQPSDFSASMDLTGIEKSVPVLQLNPLGMVVISMHGKWKQLSLLSQRLSGKKLTWGVQCRHHGLRCAVVVSVKKLDDGRWLSRVRRTPCVGWQKRESTPKIWCSVEVRSSGRCLWTWKREHTYVTKTIDNIKDGCILNGVRYFVERWFLLLFSNCSQKHEFSICDWPMKIGSSCLKEDHDDS